MGKLIALALAAGLFALLWSRAPVSPKPPMEPVVAKASDTTPASAPAVAAPRVRAETVLSFTSAENTMSSQLELLARGDIAGFRASFSVPVSDEQFSICKKRMATAHLSPDWEMAKHTMQNGQRVTKVSIFGKGMTAFREVNGRYVADSVWCVPLW